MIKLYLPELRLRLNQMQYISPHGIIIPSPLGIGGGDGQAVWDGSGGRMGFLQWGRELRGWMGTLSRTGLGG